MADYTVNTTEYFKSYIGEFKITSYVSYDGWTDFCTWSNGVPTPATVFNQATVNSMINNGMCDLFDVNDNLISTHTSCFPIYKYDSVEDFGVFFYANQRSDGSWYISRVYGTFITQANPAGSAFYLLFDGIVNVDSDIQNWLYPYVFRYTSQGAPLYITFGAWSDLRGIYLPISDFIDSLGRPYTSLAHRMYYSESDLYEVLDPSTTSDNTGSYDYTSIEIPFSDLPTITVNSTGIVTLFNPTPDNVKGFAQWLFSTNVFDTLIKAWFSPMDLIISLGIVPLTPTPIDVKEIKLGGYPTGIQASVVNQYYKVDCGELNVGEYFASFLDYINTKIHIYLPYVGVRELNTDEIMGGSISVIYNVDVFSGACVAQIKCNREYLNSVLYTFEGNILATLPLISRDYSSFYTSIAKSAVDIATSKGVFSTTDIINNSLSVLSNKPSTSKSGSISGTGGLLNIKKPYLIIERPIESTPKNYNLLNGRPSNVTFKISELSGYTEISYVNLSSIPCTESELTELKDLLINGVYF